jgi:hypothetical protein
MINDFWFMMFALTVSFVLLIDFWGWFLIIIKQVNAVCLAESVSRYVSNFAETLSARQKVTVIILKLIFDFWTLTFEFWKEQKKGSQNLINKLCEPLCFLSEFLRNNLRISRPNATILNKYTTIQLQLRDD